MKYGTVVLSKEFGLREEYFRIGDAFKNRRLTLIQTAVYIFHRPNGDVILEVDEEDLVQDKPENIFAFNDKSVKLFKGFIAEKYEKERKAIEREIEPMELEIQALNIRVLELSEKIEKLLEKNSQAYSDNRTMEIKGLEKNQRHSKNRADSQQEKIIKLRSDIDDSVLNCKYSLERADEDPDLSFAK
jgi:hypothetical protein